MYRKIINFIFVLASLLTMGITANAQSDSLHTQNAAPLDSLPQNLHNSYKPGFLPQLGFTSLGFLAGFAFGGVGFAKDNADNKEPSGSLWPFITPFTTSLGIHSISTDFFRQNGGSYLGGVAAGFLGELAGVGLQFAVSSNESLNSSPYMHAAAYFVPVVGFTMLFYNLGMDSTPTETENKMSVFPWYNNGYVGASMMIRY